MTINLRPILTRFYKIRYKIIALLYYSKYRFTLNKEEKPLENYVFFNITFLNIFKIKKQIALAFVDTVVIDEKTGSPFYYACGNLLYPMGLYEQTIYYTVYKNDEKYLVNVILVPSSMKDEYTKAMKYLKIKFGFEKDYVDYSDRAPGILEDFLHEHEIGLDRNKE